MVLHLVEQREILFEEIKEDIKMCYGGTEDTETYTYKSYCKKMMKNKVWCDIVALKAIASMWAAKITVINADTLYRTNIRHDGLPQEADFVLLFNGNYVNGHYVSCLRTDGKNFIIGVPEEGPGYDRGGDRIERKMREDYDWQEDGEEEMVCIQMSLYKTLLHKAEQCDKMKKIADEKEAEGEGLPRFPSLDPDAGRKKGSGSGRGDRRDDDGDDRGGAGVVVGDPKDPRTRTKKGEEYEPEKEIGEDEIADNATVCPRCKLDQKTHSKLMSHIKKFHKDVFNFLCEECDKGFVSKYGFKMHQKFHEKNKIKCKKANCTSEFSTVKSYKQHLRVFHPEGGMKDMPCRYCGKKFQTKSNLRQHERSFKQNPARLELFCDICGKGKFYQANKVQEHKRDIHGWQ